MSQKKTLKKVVNPYCLLNFLFVIRFECGGNFLVAGQRIKYTRKKTDMDVRFGSNFADRLDTVI